VNAPGKFRFVLEFRREAAWESIVLEWFVASEKMDVETDLAEMTEQIRKASPSLVHAFLAKTMLGAGVGRGEEKQDDNLWYSLFVRVFDEYREAVEVVIHRPHLKYIPQAEYLRAEKIKRWTPALEARFQNMDPARQPTALFRSERIDPESDTIENRFVLFTLKELARRAVAFSDACDEHESVSAEFVRRLREMSDELAKLAASPFFKGVGRFTGFKQESLALQRKPGYARIYADWFVMQQTLDPNGAQIDIGYRPVSALYEFWCFLTIRDKVAASAQFRCEHPVPEIGSLEDLGDLFEDPDADDDSIKLNKLVYKFPEQNGGTRLLTLVYQQSYNTGEAGAFVYLNPQRPDIVLTLKDTTKPEGEGEYSYIFDAKYRIRPTKGEDDKDATTTEAIDAMHRYRDAILYRKQKTDKQLSREIIGAYVLYPGRPAPGSLSYEAVIAAENIGAIPLLPAKRNADKSYKFDENGHHGEERLDEFLCKILSLSTAEQHLGLDAQGHRRVIATRGMTTVVGKGFSEDASFVTITLSGSQKWLSRIHQDVPIGDKVITLTDSEINGRIKSEIRFVRFRKQFEKDVIIEVSFCYDCVFKVL